MQSGSSALHAIGTGEGDVFPFLCPIHFITFSVHEDDEIFPAQALLHGFSDVVHQPELPALPLLCCAVLPGGKVLSTALVGVQHTQALGLADLIAELTKLFQCAWVLPQLLSVFKRVKYFYRPQTVAPMILE